jgi:osmotically-inducible protein OsmY
MLPAMRATPSLIVATLTLIALAVAVSACGDGGRPAALASTLAPSAATSVSAVPAPAATNGTAQPTRSPGAAATSTSSATPTSPSSVGPTPAKVTDASIRAAIVKRLGASPTLVGLAVGVRVVQRVVYLFGTVESKDQKAAAEHIAVTEPGIAKVVSLLKIVPGGGGY